MVNATYETIINGTSYSGTIADTYTKNNVYRVIQEAKVSGKTILDANYLFSGLDASLANNLTVCGHSSKERFVVTADGLNVGELQELIEKSAFYDDFENNLSQWQSPTTWYITSAERKFGLRSVSAGREALSELISDPIDLTEAESATLEFWILHRPESIKKGDLKLYFWNGSSWVLIDELGDYGPNNSWNKYVKEIKLNTYKLSNFKLKFSANLKSTENIFIDGLIVKYNADDCLTLNVTSKASDGQVIVSFQDKDRGESGPSAVQDRLYIDWMVITDDVDPPVTTASAKKSDNSPYTFGTWSNLDVEVTLTCNDGVSGSGCYKTYYCIDNNNSCMPNIIYNEPLAINQDGIYYVRFYSIDNVWNKETTKSAQVKISKGKPVIDDFNINNNATYTNSLNVLLYLSGTDNIYQCSFSNDGSSWSTWVGYPQPSGYSWVLQSGSDGIRTVYAKCKTSTDNESSVVQDSIILDTTKPATTANAGSYVFGTWTNNNVTVTLQCIDTTSGCKATYYCTDSTNTCDPTTTYADPITISSEGTTYLRFYSDDNAGNKESTQEKIIKIDKTGPTTTATAKKSDGSDYTFGDWSALDVNVTLSCDDGTGSGCKATYYCLSSGCTPTTVYT
ncbi:MAG: hypothetical protein N3F05_01135, partial [Candidatus Diapherotrites archaeon]|nr:hypothetical protein [Candidatus Diapherotrites archaeon]